LQKALDLARGSKSEKDLLKKATAAAPAPDSLAVDGGAQQ
jgi:hypothetical protein